MAASFKTTMRILDGLGKLSPGRQWQCHSLNGGRSLLSSPGLTHMIRLWRLTSTAVACAALGGVAQASVIPTLHDRGGGLVYDEVLNVTWLQDAKFARTSGADADGLMTWQQAVTWAAELSYFDSVRGVTYSDWRLPTVAPVNGSTFNLASPVYDGSSDLGYNISAPGSKHPGSTASELAHLFYNGLFNVANESQSLPLNTTPFVNLSGGRPLVYWSGTSTSVFGESGAFAFRFYDGLQVQVITDVPPAGNAEVVQFYALAVRDGDVAAVPEPQVMALWLAGLCMLSLVAGRRT